MTFAISAQAASSELQNPSKMVAEALSELPKTLPRAPREVPGASRRPLRSGPRRFQRHLSSARGLRSTSEAALKAFRGRFGCKLRAPSLLFFVFSLPLAAAFLPRVVGVLLLLFDVALVLRATVFLAFRCYGGAVVASVLSAKDALAFRCNGSASLRANEGRTKPLGARSTYSVIRATMQVVNR